MLTDKELSALDKDQIKEYLKAKSRISEAESDIENCQNRIKDSERYMAQAENQHKSATEMIKLLKKVAKMNIDAAIAAAKGE